MNNIEQYLVALYPKSKNYKLYYKIYYQRYKKRILDYNNKRYDKRLNKGKTKFTRGEFIIKFN